MEKTNQTPVCPGCGKQLAADAPKGLCQECLLMAGFATGTAMGDQPSASKFVPPRPEELAAVFPQLQILELLGHGGMGVVYRARQKQLDRLVALKILPPQIAAGPGFADRFAREARALARLNHPHIVTLYEFGQAGRLYFFLMEYVDGINLRQVLNAGRMSPKEALAIVPQICEALEFAHEEGIVHRDIKPENILLDKKGKVKIADFGIAKIVSQETAEPPDPGGATRPGELTQAGELLGTPHYMAPEQVDHPLEVDGRADIYSLGVVFYQMLTGELPVGKFEPPSRKVVIDVRLDEVVLRAIAKQPELRYQQVSTFKAEVENVLASPPPVAAPGPAPAPRPAPAPGKRPPASRFRVPPILARLKWILIPVAAVTVIILAIRAFFLQSFTADTNAAAPAVPRGSSFLVWKHANGVVSGRLIAYRRDGWVGAGHVVRDDGDSLLVDRFGEAQLTVPRGAVLGAVAWVFHITTRADARTIPASAEIWAPTLAHGEKPDLAGIRESIKSLMDQGQYEEALQHQIWYFNHAAEYGEIDPVRETFGIMNCGTLMQAYPKARDALTEIRDKDAQKFRQDRPFSAEPKSATNAPDYFLTGQMRSRFALFQEIACLNDLLGDAAANSAMIGALRTLDPQLARHMGYRVGPDHVAGALDHTNAAGKADVGDGQRGFAAIRDRWESMRQGEVHLDHIYAQVQAGMAMNRQPQPGAQPARFMPPAPPKMATPPKVADTTFVDNVRKLIQILVDNGRTADAEKIRDQALALVDDPWLKSAVTDAQTNSSNQPPSSGRH